MICGYGLGFICEWITIAKANNGSKKLVNYLYFALQLKIIACNLKLVSLHAFANSG